MINLSSSALFAYSAHASSNFSLLCFSITNSFPVKNSLPCVSQSRFTSFRKPRG